MKPTVFWLTCAVATSLLPSGAFALPGEVKSITATAADPSDMYLQAWGCVDAAEKAAKKTDYMTAVNKLREGEAILAAISRDRPDWKTNMVNFRRQKNTELLEKWNQLAREQAARQPVAPPVEKKPIVFAPAPLPTPTNRSLPEANQPTYESMQAKVGKSPYGRPEQYAPPSLPEQGESSYDRLNREFMKSQMENRALIKALQQTRRDLEEALIRKNIAQSGESVYKKQLDDIRAEIEKERATGNELLVNLSRRLNEAEAKLKEAEKNKQNVQSELEQLTQRLKETETQLAEVSQERDSLKEERDSLKKDRDHLAAILELNSPEKTKNLLDRNMTLVAQLKEAQEKIKTLEGEKINSDDQKAVNLQELERTREESVKIKLSLAALMDENVGYRRRITELNTQLTNSEAELSKLSKLPKADPMTIEENKLLRATVTKQLRLVSNQIKIRDLMMDAYKRLKLQDPAMVESIQMLGNSALVQLTPEEKKLAESIQAQYAENREKEASIQNELNDAAQTAKTEHEKTIRRQLESEALGKAAEASFAKGRFAAAEQLYRTLLDDQPDLFPARVNMAAILLRRNLVSEAIKHLDKAIQIDPNSAPANFLLGIAHYKAKNDKQAVTSFLETVRIQPDNVQAYIYLGNIENSAKHTDKAVEYYDKALSLKPSMPDVLFNKASTLAEAKKLKEAREAYDQAIRAGSLPDPDLEHSLMASNTPNEPAATGKSVEEAAPPTPATAVTPVTTPTEPSSSPSPAKAPLPANQPAPQKTASPAPPKASVEKKAEVKRAKPTPELEPKPAEAAPQKKAIQPTPEEKPKEEPAKKQPRSRHFRIG